MCKSVGRALLPVAVDLALAVVLFQTGSPENEQFQQNSLSPRSLRSQRLKAFPLPNRSRKPQTSHFWSTIPEGYSHGPCSCRGAGSSSWIARQIAAPCNKEPPENSSGRP